MIKCSGTILNEKIKVMIVDDDAEWLKVMTTYINLEDDMKVVAAASNSDEAFRLAEVLHPDVILMDINLTGEEHDGIPAVLELLEAVNVKIIMFSCIDNEKAIKNSFTAGAVNFIPKTRYMDIPKAVRTAYNDNSPLDVLLKDYIRLKHEEQLKSLTAAERQILELIEKNHTHAEICKMLYKSESTLKNQINKIMKKLNVKNSREAVQKIKRKGIS